MGETVGLVNLLVGFDERSPAVGAGKFRSLVVLGDVGKGVLTASLAALLRDRPVGDGAPRIRNLHFASLPLAERWSPRGTCLLGRCWSSCCGLLAERPSQD